MTKEEFKKILNTGITLKAPEFDNVNEIRNTYLPRMLMLPINAIPITKDKVQDLITDIAKTSGVVKGDTIELKVPLLAIVPIPAIKIDAVNINFDLEVKAYQNAKNNFKEQGLDLNFVIPKNLSMRTITIKEL